MSNPTQKEAEIALRLSNSYFSNIKKKSPVSYRFMKLIGRGNLINGYLAYKNYGDDKKYKVQDIYYKFDREKDFIDWLIKRNIYKKKLNVSDVIMNLFSTSNQQKLFYTKKLKRIIKAYNEDFPN